MSMTISRKSAGVKGLKDLLNEPLMPKKFQCQHEEATEMHSVFLFW